MTDRFSKAYNALVKAYFEGTLASGNCRCCAVGNIVAAAQGGVVKLMKSNFTNGFTATCSTGNSIWGGAVWGWSDLYKSILKCEDGEYATSEELKKLTGYSPEELSLIERAFENNSTINIALYGKKSEQEILEDQYKALSAVVNVMLEFDNIESNPSYAQKLREHKKLQA